MMPFIYQDKENTTEPVVLDARTTTASTHRLPGKSFQANAISSTPRRALGDVNTRNIVSGKNQWGTLGNTPHPLKKSSHTFKKPCPETKVPAPASKPPTLKPKNNQKKKFGSGSTLSGPMQRIKAPDGPVKASGGQVRGSIQVYCDDKSEVEQMHLPPEHEDDFEDIWPKADRPESWIGLMKDWRPKAVCTFYDLDQDSGDEDSLVQPDEIFEEILELEDSIDVSENPCRDCWITEEANSQEEGPKLEDIVLPPLNQLHT